MIDALILDYGGVVIHEDPGNGVPPLATPGPGQLFESLAIADLMTAGIGTA